MAIYSCKVKRIATLPARSEKMKFLASVALYCLFFGLPVSTTAPATSDGDYSRRAEELESQIHHLSQLINLYEESNSRPQRQASAINVINENQVPKRCCMEILKFDSAAVTGLYRIAPTDGKGEFTVCCEMTPIYGGGWTVIQRRIDNSTNFYRNWQEYKTGFGEMDGNFWLGLEKIHRLTQIASHEVMFVMTNHENETFIAKYDLFKVDSEATDYQLEIGQYINSESNAGDSLHIHKNQKFSTYDHDNDIDPKENCAVEHHGGWWYKHCHESNLNGRYYNGDYGNYNGSNPSAVADGIVWFGAQGWWHSMKTVMIAIRSISP